MSTPEPSRCAYETSPDLLLASGWGPGTYSVIGQGGCSELYCSAQRIGGACSRTRAETTRHRARNNDSLLKHSPPTGT